MSDKSDNLHIAAIDLYEAMNHCEPMTVIDSVAAIFDPERTRDQPVAAASLALVSTWNGREVPANPALDYDYAPPLYPMDVSRDGAVHGHVVVDPQLMPHSGISPIVGFQPVTIDCSIAEALAAATGDMPDSLRTAHVKGAAAEMFDVAELPETFGVTVPRIDVWSFRCVDLAGFVIDKVMAAEDYYDMDQYTRTTIERFHEALAEWVA